MNKRIILKNLDIIILSLIKVGPIIVLNTVPGNEPIEKQAKNKPAKDLSNKK